MKRGLPCLIALGLVILLSACASKPRTTASGEVPRVSWQQHQRIVNGLEQWMLTARVSVKTRDKAWSGKVHWQQQGGQYHIQFSAPFGQGAFRLDGSPAGVEMQLADGEAYVSTDAETLIFEQLGWRFPLGGLRYWVKGVPDPSLSPVLSFDEDGRLATLKQTHWRISYPDYLQVGKLFLPRKVYLQNTELSVRLVIDQWELHGV